jgi:hypothetical protein
MAHSATTLACPTWCTAHETDADGQSHAATTVTTAAGTISMHQIADVPDSIFAPQDQPTIWFGDVPMSVSAAAEAAAVLAGLVAAVLAR